MANHGITIVRNVYFSGLRLVIASGTSLCTSAIIARSLGPVNTGVYGYAVWIAGTLSTLVSCGLPSAITKYVSEYIGRGEPSVAAHLARRVLLTQFCIAFCAALAVSFLALARPDQQNLILAAAALLLVQALQQGLTASLSGVQRFDQSALVSLYGGLLHVAAVGVAALLGCRIIGMLWASVFANAVGDWLCYKAVRRFLLDQDCKDQRSRPSPSDVTPRVIKFSITISYILILDAVVWQRSEVLFLKWYSAASEIAFYTLAYSLASKVADISSTFAAILLPLYSERFGRNDLASLGTAWSSAVRLSELIMVPLCICVGLAAEPIVVFVYGHAYQPLVLPFQILVVTVAVTTIGAVGSPLLVGTEKQGFMACYGTLIAVVNIFLDVLLIPRFGATGASVANCVAQLCGVIGGTAYITRWVGLDFPWKSCLRIYTASITASLPFVYALRPAHRHPAALAMSVVVYATLYIGFVLAVGDLRPMDVKTLRSALSRHTEAGATPRETAAVR